MNKRRLVVAGIGFLLSSGNGLAQQASRGAEPFKVCAVCHGSAGEGNEQAGAPKLAGQASWYLARQIKNFRDGIRSGSDAGEGGHTMSRTASGMMSDGGIQDIVAYIATLPDKPAAHTVEGDVATGQQLYAACADCHGAAARGEATKYAPALAGMSDWYLLGELARFRSGDRGADYDDAHGQEMVPAAEALADEQAMRDVVAYIDSL